MAEELQSNTCMHNAITGAKKVFSKFSGSCFQIMIDLWFENYINWRNLLQVNHYKYYKYNDNDSFIAPYETPPGGLRDISLQLGQGFPTCGPWAASPQGNSVRPAKPNASMYLLN